MGETKQQQSPRLNTLCTLNAPTPIFFVALYTANPSQSFNVFESRPLALAERENPNSIVHLFFLLFLGSSALCVNFRWIERCSVHFKGYLIT